MSGTISDQILDLTGQVPYIGATVTAYKASDQGLTLNAPDGSALAPLGLSQAQTVTDSTGKFTLTGLTAGVLYHLYVTPADSLLPTFWMPDKLTDIAASVKQCVLHGVMADHRDTDVIWAFLEYPSVVQGGLHISQGVTYATISQYGYFSLSLWPTQYLTPPSLYRVTLGESVYRGSVPVQESIDLTSWLALTTTQILA